MFIRTRRMVGSAAPMAALLLCCAACGGAAPAPPEPGPPPLPPLGPLPLLLPAGAELVLVAKPAELMSSPAVRRVVDAVTPPELLDAFARRTGVEPHEVEEVVFAEYETGFLLLARGPWPAADVVRAAEQRMNSIEARSDAPFFRRSGWLGTERRDLTALAEHVLLVTADAPLETAAVLARAERGSFAEDDGGAALEDPELGPLLAEVGDAPVLLVVPEPLALPPGLGTTTLLSGERALSATLTPSGQDGLALTVTLIGAFPEGAEHNFRALVDSVANSGLGVALGIAEALETLRIQVEEGSVVLRLRLSAPAVAVGLRMLFLAEIREIVAPPEVR